MNENYGYRGIVKTSYEVNGKRFGTKTHNDGTDDLFWFFAKALCWDSVYDYRPRYIDLGYTVEGGQYYSIINRNARIQIKPLLNKYHDGNTDKWCAYIVASIPHESLLCSPSDYTGAKSWHLRILSAYYDKVGNDYMELARAEISGGAPNIAKGTQLFVEWYMFVQNGSSSLSQTETTNSEEIVAEGTSSTNISEVSEG